MVKQAIQFLPVGVGRIRQVPYGLVEQVAPRHQPHNGPGPVGREGVEQGVQGVYGNEGFAARRGHFHAHVGGARHVVLVGPHPRIGQRVVVAHFVLPIAIVGHIVAVFPLDIVQIAVEVANNACLVRFQFHLKPGNIPGYFFEDDMPLLKPFAADQAVVGVDNVLLGRGLDGGKEVVINRSKFVGFVDEVVGRFVMLA